MVYSTCHHPKKTPVHLRVTITSRTQLSLDSINIIPGFKNTQKNTSAVFHDLCNLLVIYFIKMVPDGCALNVTAPPLSSGGSHLVMSSEIFCALQHFGILFITCNYFRISNEILLQARYLLLKAYPHQKEYDSKLYAERKLFY